MAHLKRQEIPKNWPVMRKGATFIVKPSSNNGIPLLVALRDILKVAQTRREVKKALGSLLVNNKFVKDEKRGLSLFDKISFVNSKKYYAVVLSEKGKFVLKEIEEKEANKKMAKVIGKKILKGKKTQLNLNDGRNFLSNIKCNINDSVLINFKDKKIEKCFPLQENTKVLVFAGKHAGEVGKVEKIKKERKMASINNGKEKLNILIKQIIAIE